VLAASAVEIPATKSAKSDTAVLSSKAKTSRLKPVETGAIKAAPVPEQAPSRPTALTAALLGGVLLAGIAGGLAWILGGGIQSQSVIITPAAPPANNTPSTNSVAEIVASTDPLEPVPTPKPTLAMDEEVIAPVEIETNKLPELLAALRSPDIVQRRFAAEEFCTGHTTITNALLNLRLALLQDADPEVRMWLAATLVKHEVYDLAALTALVEALRHDRPELRLQACSALSQFPYDESGRSNVIAALQSAAADENEQVRTAARNALKAIAPEATASK
jgi:hypothetical protein